MVFSFLRNMTLEQLLDVGWIVRLDEERDSIIGVRSVIHDWNNLPWAEQTYSRAKYGFSQIGLLDIDLFTDSADSKRLGIALSPNPSDGIVLPPEQIPGSNNRLWSILSKSRVSVGDYRYDDIGLVHFGPDGTVILTCDYLWALSSPRDNERGEFDEKYMCYWESSPETWTPTAPWWARGPGGDELYEFPIKD